MVRRRNIVLRAVFMYIGHLQNLISPVRSWSLRPGFRFEAKQLGNPVCGQMLEFRRELARLRTTTARRPLLQAAINDIAALTRRSPQSPCNAGRRHETVRTACVGRYNRRHRTAHR